MDDDRFNVEDYDEMTDDERAFLVWVEERMECEATCTTTAAAI